jgi:hypothetical protein
MAYANAFVIKAPASVEVDGVEMKDQIWVLTGTPDQEIQQQRTFGGVDTDVDTAVWTLGVTCHNSRKAGALVKAIDTARAAGDNMEFVIQLKPGTGEDVVTVTVVPVAVGFGGEAGSWHSAEIELPMVGEPAYSVSA